MKQILGFFFGLFTIIGYVAFWLFGSAFILALPVMWCWDFIMPKLFALREITYWEAFALYILCGLLFKSTKTIEKEK
jgi:hypothetical protein